MVHGGNLVCMHGTVGWHMAKILYVMYAWTCGRVHGEKHYSPHPTTSKFFIEAYIYSDLLTLAETCVSKFPGSSII